MKRMTKRFFDKAKDAFEAWAFLHPGTGAVTLRLNGHKGFPISEICETILDDGEIDRSAKARSLEELVEFYEEIPKEIVRYDAFGNAAVVRRSGNGYRFDANGASIRKKSMLQAVRAMVGMGYVHS